MEQWNNVELSDLSKKSYTLNHSFDLSPKNQSTVNNVNNNNNNNNNNSIENSQTKTNGESQLLQPGSNIKPNIRSEEVESLARRLYGITISELKELIAYDDRNYLINEDSNIKNPLIVSHSPDGYVLKILNTLDSQKVDFVDAQNQLLMFLSKQNINCPKPIANVNGKYYSVEHINGGDHVVRLLEYIPGKIFHEIDTTNYLLYQSGEYLAKVDRALKNFTHIAYETHKTTWMLQSIPNLKDFVYVLKDHTRKALVEEIIAAFETNVLSQLNTFEKQIIHGDYNEQNIIVDNGKNEENDYKIIGVIDFGDTTKSPLLFEIGIALTYMMLQAKSLERGGIFLAGYYSIQNLKNNEKLLLKYCVGARLAQSLVMGAYTHSLDPSNEYVLVTQEQGWKLIEELWREKFENIDEIWQIAGDKYLTQSIK